MTSPPLLMLSTLIGLAAEQAVGIDTVPCPQETGTWNGLAGSKVAGAAGVMGTSVAWRICCRGRCRRRALGRMMQ